MNILKDLVSNNVLLSALYSWFLAQFLKITIEIVKRNKFKTKDFIFRALLGTGGMPSSHSASITSVAVSIGITSGFGSPIFALAFVMVFIVIRDATGVRLSSGKQAQALNLIMEELYSRYNISFKKIKEVKGHTALECFIGVIIGIFVSLGMYLL
ncbi:MAG TPA: divergent PAP2 family protein [Spirochaetota bacterium]|nr:divergent PAP2 family protein [Spirochaetota bacterium]